MSKYIIEVGDAYAEYVCGKGDMLCLPVRINEFEDNWLNTDIPLTPYTEPDMEKIREEGYEQGKMDAYVEDSKNITMLKKEAEEAYQRGMNDAKEGKATCQYCEYQYLDDTEEPCKKCCKAYMNKYKPKAKEQQIQVGDEVISPDGKAVVTEISDRNVRIMYSNGSGYVTQLEELTKIGRHFPEIAEVLRKMKEES